MTLLVHVTPEGEWTSEDADLGGRVDVQDGCVRLSGEPVVWPVGTTLVRGEPLAIGLPDGVVVVDGGVVAGGGGVASRPQSRIDLDREAACVGDAPVTIFNPIGAIEVER